jgi:isopentenyl-diphosphate Delta-isomerase
MEDANNANNCFMDVLDENGIRTGEVCSKSKIHEMGKYHRAVHLYLLDKSNRLLLQRRSMFVDHYPGMFSISLTGHVDAGESSGDAVKREIGEELSFDPKNMDIEFLFSFKQSMTIRPNYIDKQFNDIFFCQHEFSTKDILFDQTVITEIKLVSLNEFAVMVANIKTDFSKVYAKEASDVMHFLRRKIGLNDPH